MNPFEPPVADRRSLGRRLGPTDRKWLLGALLLTSAGAWAALFALMGEPGYGGVPGGIALIVAGLAIFFWRMRRSG